MFSDDINSLMSPLDAEEKKKHPLKNSEPDKTLKNRRNCQ